MRTLIISYDLANPYSNKHALAQEIMAAGHSWARPLDQTWYMKTGDREEAIVARLSALLTADDGLLVQEVQDDAVLTNTALRWFRQRRAAFEITDDSNVVAFPASAEPNTQPELPLATAC